MNWKERLITAKPGQKVIIIESNYRNSSYIVGKIYTLKEKYIAKGRWIQDGTPIGNKKLSDMDFWITEELKSGISNNCFKILRD